MNLEDIQKRWKELLLDPQLENQNIEFPSTEYTVYRDLLRYNILSYIRSNFSRTIEKLNLSIEELKELIDKYRRQFNNKSFQFYKVAQDFPLFLQQEYQDDELYELALYEWYQLYIYLAPNNILYVQHLQGEYLLLYRDSQTNQVRNYKLDAISAQYIYLTQRTECQELNTEEIIEILSLQLNKPASELTSHINQLKSILQEKSINI